MSRFFLGLTAIMLAMGSFVALNSSRASDDDIQSVLTPKEAPTEIAQLRDRILQLEKRLDALEGREPLIQQADSRETTDVDEGAPAPVVVPTEPVEPPPVQNTNGQRWRFRLLNYRQSVENPDQAPKLEPVPSRRRVPQA